MTLPTPEEALFRSHLDLAEFQMGVDSGKSVFVGTVEEIVWPMAFFWVAASAKAHGRERYEFRFDLSGYSAQAPTACPWDVTRKERLAISDWPKGPRVSSVFRPNDTWPHGQNALYAPCDRVAIPGHEKVERRVSRIILDF